MTDHIQKEIEETEKRLEELKEKQKEEAAKPYEYRLAEKLHAIHCKHNHTDMCSWMYESWDNPGYAKKQYLEKARYAIVTGVTMKDIERVQSVLNH